MESAWFSVLSRSRYIPLWKRSVSSTRPRRSRTTNTGRIFTGQKRKRSPLHPAALANLGKIDKTLGKTASQFWQLVWKKEDPAIDQKTKYLLSLANAVGAGRLRQATRELVKAYSAGVTVPELDELFTLFVWNQGIGNFASEIGPSPLFASYQLIERLESEGMARDGVIAELVKKFGEANPDVSVLEQKK